LYDVSTKFGSRQLDVSVATSVIKPMHINMTYALHEYDDILQNGLAINVAPCGLAGTVASTVATVALFTGANSTAVADKNVAFMEARGLFDARCASFDGNLHSSMPLVPTPVRLKRACV
jgi:hypothetical protein